LGDLPLLKALMPDLSRWRVLVKFILCLLALIVLIITLARPQMGLKTVSEERRGIEVMVALDVSNSMLAEDVSPNRLEKAKMLISRMADKMSNDKIGLIVFAGDAFIQLPITSDFVSAKMFLDAISPEMVGTQGTNIGEAIRLAMNSFTTQEGVTRAVMVLTDGEDHEGEAESMAAEVAKAGMHLYMLGIGSEKGAKIPYNGGFLKDNSGNEVVTMVNTSMCEQLASLGKGAYIHVDNSSVAQDQLLYEINKLEKQNLGATSYSEYNEQFMWFAWLALLLLVFDTLILEKRNPWFSRIKIFNRK
jgi:Ca-activated chloride channel family protein